MTRTTSSSCMLDMTALLCGLFRTADGRFRTLGATDRRTFHASIILMHFPCLRKAGCRRTHRGRGQDQLQTPAPALCAALAQRYPEQAGDVTEVIGKSVDAG